MDKFPTSLEALTANQELLRELLSFHLTDAGNAGTLTFLYGRWFRYDHTRGKWLFWNGRYWEVDETGKVYRAALQTALARLSAAMTIVDPNERKRQVGWALGSEGVNRLNGMLAIARSNETFATKGADYNKNNFLLTVGNGTLDLRTGDLRPFNPDDLITLATDIAYEPDAPCLRWDLFLEQIFAGNKPLIKFVQRAAGYSLTGDTSEHCLFMLVGGGANGKSTFLELLLQLVGSYGAVTSFATLLEQQNPGAPRNDIAALHSARLVKAAESQKQAKLDAAIVKELTGGDKVSARYLYHEPFEFHPQFKIWLATNHRPHIREIEDAIWRRIRNIPFERQFTGKQRDARLRTKLEAELNGILAWAVRGCLDWQRTASLGDPEVVNKATLNYRRESDPVGRFLIERCTNGSRDQAFAQELFEAYVEWCGENGERPENNNVFAKTLSSRGISKKRTNRGNIYVGVGLRPRIKRVEMSDEGSRGSTNGGV